VPFLPGEEYAAYYVVFEREENLERHLLTKDGFFNGQTEPVKLDGKKLHLHKDLFNQDALVFKNLVSRKVTIGSSNHTHRLSVEFPGFNYLGIWAKPQAPFVCIEPWLGCADTDGKPVDISQKEAIQQVNTGNTFEASFTIRISD
jgi:galactose mutarotase-like enzyme